ncbi:Protein pitchfork [Plecturocebus cupreus]
MCFSKADTADNYCFGTCQQRKLFPHFHPPNLIGNKFVPLRGSPHRGPGCYLPDTYGLAYNLSKIPTSIKGYTLGARTAVRFKPIQKEMTPHAGMYQQVSPQQEKHKQNFAPFNVLPWHIQPREEATSKNFLANEIWISRLGSGSLSTDKDFRKHRNRVAYLSLYYN